MNIFLSYMKLSLVICVIILSFGCAIIPAQKTPVQSVHYVDKSISKSIRAQYLLYLPVDYSDSKKEYPLIMFLHGSGERGTQIEKLKIHGIPAYLESRKDFPFIVVAPQCPDKEYYDNDTLIAVLDEVEKQFRVDKTRVYLTGLSMGGFGTWCLACAHPERFAAIAPVSGWGLSDLVENIKDMPVWAFHGEDDKAVPLRDDQEMVDELKKAGGNVKFTVYPKLGHNIWKQTYENEELYKWFLEHKKN